jgi:hypothetical protein
LRLLSIRILMNRMQSFISPEHRDLLKKKEHRLLLFYFLSLAVVLGVLLTFIFVHDLAHRGLYLGLSIALGVFFALWSVFFWDYLFRRNHGYLRLETLSLYAKTTLLEGTLSESKETLYRGYLPLTSLSIAYVDEKGPHTVTLLTWPGHPWENGAHYTFVNYSNFVTGLAQ